MSNSCNVRRCECECGIWIYECSNVVVVIVATTCLLWTFIEQVSENGVAKKNSDNDDDDGEEIIKKGKALCVHKWIVFSVYNSRHIYIHFYIFICFVRIFKLYGHCGRASKVNENAAVRAFTSTHELQTRISMCMCTIFFKVFTTNILRLFVLAFCVCMWVVWTVILLMSREKFGAFFFRRLVSIAQSYFISAFTCHSRLYRLALLNLRKQTKSSWANQPHYCAKRRNWEQELKLEQDSERK